MPSTTAPSRTAPSTAATAAPHGPAPGTPERALDRLQALNDRLQASRVARFAQRFIDDDIPALAAALAFYTLLSLAPLVTMLLWLTTSLYPAAQDEFFRQVGLLVGAEVEATARLIVANAEREPRTGSLAALLGTLALLVGASIVFGQLQAALNRVFRSDAKRLGGVLAWLRKRLLSFGMAVALGFLLVVSMAAQAGLQLLVAYLPALLPVFVALFSFLLYSLAFAAMYRWLPDRSVGGRRALLGGALTASMFMAGRAAIGLYLGQASLGSAYGPAGGLVVMLVWLYYCAVVFLVGALITAMLDEHARVRQRVEQVRRQCAKATDAAAGVAS
ncbi:YihY/virulence factor BrkB family protein [Novilysobacter selenitireducens]|uniref:YihY/virulence factor BrkB family protein n=1 Tax=Novilysobacter selenitireducens TaxID=2872639 RepID=A0ABS7T886_9GAMM|nr:YihY/virulence factor BrkB family protein [Lysobacter selenitireducens]MBZ4040052.1 YihY/virulence factor BrkB family protein [Lysobacter selenitireducens]